LSNVTLITADSEAALPYERGPKLAAGECSSVEVGTQRFLKV
jgi:hypothetical protein